MNQEIKKIWLKNTTNGLIYQIWEHERGLYDPVATVSATPEEVEAWVNGTYWNRPVVVVEKTDKLQPTPQPTPQPVKKPEPTNLTKKNKAELLEILKSLDPETTLNENTTNAEIIQSIEVFRSLA